MVVILRATKLTTKLTTEVPWRVDEAPPNLIVSFGVSLVEETTGRDDEVDDDAYDKGSLAGRRGSSKLNRKLSREGR